MKLTVKVKLLPTDKQRNLLRETMETYNKARNYVSQVAFDNHTSSVVRIHHLVYYDIRRDFGLSSQMAVRVLGDVAKSYKQKKNIKHTFRPTSSITYDKNNFSWKKEESVSIYLMSGRELIKYSLSEYQERLLDNLSKGQVILSYELGEYYLVCNYDKEDKQPKPPKGYLGVDLGVNKLAVDSTGKVYSGTGVDKLREKIESLRASLQKRGTKSAKRHLKKLSGKESRYRRDVNHCISKKIISKARRHNLGIALENLKGIRGVTVRKSQRRKHNSWAFAQLRFFIDYKAKLAGVELKIVNPKYTSQRCSECGYVKKTNRKSQERFECGNCGFKYNADKNGAINIAYVAVTNQPIVSS